MMLAFFRTLAFSRMLARTLTIGISCLLLASLISFSAPSTLSAQSEEDSEKDTVINQLDEAQRRVDAVSAEIEEAQKKVNSAQTVVDAAQARVEEARRQANEVTELHGNIDAEIYLVEAERERLQAEIATTEAQVEALRSEVNKVAVDLYIKSGQPPSLFGNEDVVEQMFEDALARFATQDNLDLVEQFRELQDDLAIAAVNLAQIEQDLVEREAAAEASLVALTERFLVIEAEQALLVSERDRLAGLRDEQNKRRTELQESVNILQARLDEIEDEERRREAERAAAAAQALLEAQKREPAETGLQYTTINNIQVRSGPDWVCPVAGEFTHYKDWRAPRAAGGWHKGNDLFALRWTPLVSTESGRVVHRWNRVGGLSVHITADSGNYYYYTHLEGYENESAEGQWLPAGTVVGYMGNSGNAATTPVHLHFEFHQGGKGNYVNPYPYIRANCFG